MSAGELEAGIVGLDVTVLTDFYVEVLGFTVTARLDYPQGSVHRLRRGEARLKIFYPAQPARPRPPTASWHEHGGFRYAALYLASAEEVRTLARTVGEAGGAVVQGPDDISATKCIALVTDVEDNLLELIWEA